MTTYTTEVKQILPNGDAIIELPEELVVELGWQVGDRLDISLEDNAIIIKNIDKK